MILIPFALTGPQDHVAMTVVGFGLLVLFALWEHFWAPSPYVPYRLLKIPSILGASLVTSIVFMSFYCWEGFFTSYLQVVVGLDIAKAGYIGNIYNVAGVIWAIVVGILIRVTGRYKWISWACLPSLVLGGTMMCIFRWSITNVVFLIICQLFISIGGGTAFVSGQMASMAVAEHGQVAATLAILSLAGAIGGSVGGCMSGAIWSTTVPTQLKRLLPPDALGHFDDIYQSLDVQLSYAFGDPVRTAVIEAYVSTAPFRLHLPIHHYTSLVLKLAHVFLFPVKCFAQLRMLITVLCSLSPSSDYPSPGQ